MCVSNKISSMRTRIKSVINKTFMDLIYGSITHGIELLIKFNTLLFTLRSVCIISLFRALHPAFCRLWHCFLTWMIHSSSCTYENQMREREHTRATSSHKSSNNPHTVLYLCPNTWHEKPCLSDWSSHAKTWEIQKKCKAETHRCVLELLLSLLH